MNTKNDQCSIFCKKTEIIDNVCDISVGRVGIEGVT